MSKINATVAIAKSFDDGTEFEKAWENGDFQKFFSDEGEYLDGLSKVLDSEGNVGDEFEVIFMVSVTKTL